MIGAVDATGSQHPHTPRPPLEQLDFPVAVPADLALADLRVVGSGWGGSGGPDALVRWGNVDVALRTHPDEDADPPWQLSTRPRRGAVPAGPPGKGLLVDPDVASLAEDAVGSVLLRRLPPGLDREERRRRLEEDQRTAQRLRAAFVLLPPPESPWELRALDVDGRPFAWWVHEDELGWAAVADLGAVLLVGHGTGSAPRPWPLRMLPPGGAAELLARD
jgi:hypothetical protein